MSRIRLYEEKVNVSSLGASLLKKVFRNHLLIYNQALTLLHDDREIEMSSFLYKMNGIIRRTKFRPIIQSAVSNEVYYQYRKFRRNLRGAKKLTDIQYLTLTSSSYNNEQFVVSEDKKSIEIKDIGVILRLDKPLPCPGDRDFLYFNLSYSSSSDEFRLSIYATYSK